MDDQEIYIHFTSPDDTWEFNITTKLKEGETLVDFLHQYFDDFIIFDTEDPEYEVLVPDYGLETLLYITEVTDVTGLPSFNTDLLTFFDFSPEKGNDFNLFDSFDLFGDEADDEDPDLNNWEGDQK